MCGSKSLMLHGLAIGFASPSARINVQPGKQAAWSRKMLT
jgi:hypothetical protein